MWIYKNKEDKQDEIKKKKVPCTVEEGNVWLVRIRILETPLWCRAAFVRMLDSSSSHESVDDGNGREVSRME